MKKLILVLLLSPALAWSENHLSLDAHLGLSHDDNVARAADDKDIKSDTIIELGGAVSHTHVLNADSHLLFSGDIVLQQYQDFDKLSNLELGLGMDYRLQFENHFNAPWYFMSARYAFVDYDSSFRDGDYIELGIGLGKRLTDRVKLIAGLRLHDGTADNDNFSTRSDAVYVNFDYLLSHTHTLYALLELSDGDILSTSSNPYPAPLQGSGHYHTGDDAFPGFTDPWTYKLNATTVSLRIGDSILLAHKQSLDIAALYYNADADYGMSYDGLILDLTYFYRF